MKIKSIGVSLVSLLAFGAVFLRAAPVPLVVPPEPRIKPEIPSFSQIDKDGNKVDDLIDSALNEANEVVLKATVAAEEKTKAQAVLDETIRVTFVFDRQITQEELKGFVRSGGEIRNIYQNFYGWSGQIPRSKVHQTANLMKKGFLAVVASRPVNAYLHTATRVGLVRQQWPLGYSGASDTAIAFLDTGIDGSHPDLAGREVPGSWFDFTSEGFPNAADVNQHGTHVAGIALGSGAASGANPTQMRFTDANVFPPGFWSYWLGSSEVPTPNGGSGDAKFDWNGTLNWTPYPGANEVVNLFYGQYQNWDNGLTTINDVAYFGLTPWIYTSTSPTMADSLSAFPQGIPCPYVGTGTGGRMINSSLFRTFAVPISGTWYLNMIRYGLTSTLTARNNHNFGVGDNYNLESGVAPGCKWVGYKVLYSSGGGLTDDIYYGIDRLITEGQNNNVKVANMSFGGPEEEALIRGLVYQAVNSGVFISVAAGNGGPNPGMTDPARAGVAMTVVAANNYRQLTEYSTFGFTDGETGGYYSGWGQDKIKPDITAPGGSFYHGLMMSVDSNNSDGSSSYPDQRTNDYTSMAGTSMAAPFVSGCAALVIDAWQQAGHVWQYGSPADPLFVKMLLCATATEMAGGREYNPGTAGPGVNNPTIGRAITPKDPAEGYGFINVDAAIECLRRSLTGTPINETLGTGRFEKHASGFNVALTAYSYKSFYLTVPTGADYDMYLYSATPDSCGNPVIVASATSATLGGTETISLSPPVTGTYYLVVKRVSGTGQFTLR